MLKEIILNAIKEVNKEANNKALNNINDDTPLFDNLDSVAVLDLILELEDEIQAKYGKYIQIADEDIMDGSKTPFKSIATLIDFLTVKLNH